MLAWRRSWAYIGGIEPSRRPDPYSEAVAMRIARSLAVAVGILLLAALMQACSSSESSNTPSGTVFQTVGFAQSSPNIDGTWRSTSTVTSSTCGVGVALLGGTQIVELAQSDTNLVVSVFGPCGTPIATGTGTISHQSGASLAFGRSVTVSDTCTLNVQTTQSGLVQRGVQNIGGSSKLTISGVGSCGGGFPCEVSARLLMERCPPASCTFQNCQP